MLCLLETATPADSSVGRSPLETQADSSVRRPLSSRDGAGGGYFSSYDTNVAASVGPYRSVTAAKTSSRTVGVRSRPAYRLGPSMVELMMIDDDLSL